MNPFRSIVLLACISLSSACSDGGDTSASQGADGGGACAPGMQIACACPGGGEGVQVCLPDGSGFNVCDGCDTLTGDADGTGTASTTSPTSTTEPAGTTEPAETTAPPSTTTTTADTDTADTADETTAAPLACPGGPGELDLQLVTLHDNPPNLVNWPVTTTLTRVDFTADGVHVEFDKLDGPERWPDIIPPMWDGPLQYTLGMAECIDGQWHASAAMQYWYGLYAQGGNVALDDQVAINWYYDARWGELAGRQPATGETIGIFVVAGNARGVFEDTPLQSPVMERSNVVLVPMPDVNGASHSF